MNEKDSAKMVLLAKEGKLISKIWREDFPEYSYDDVYMAVYGSGEKGSMGVKRMITNRLNKLVTLPPTEQEGMIEEINGYVTYLYEKHISSQKRIDQIRSIIEG